MHAFTPVWMKPDTKLGVLHLEHLPERSVVAVANGLRGRSITLQGVALAQQVLVMMCSWAACHARSIRTAEAAGRLVQQGLQADIGSYRQAQSNDSQLYWQALSTSMHMHATGCMQQAGKLLLSAALHAIFSGLHCMLYLDALKVTRIYEVHGCVSWHAGSTCRQHVGQGRCRQNLGRGRAGAAGGGRQLRLGHCRVGGIALVHHGCCPRTPGAQACPAYGNGTARAVSNEWNFWQAGLKQHQAFQGLQPSNALAAGEGKVRQLLTSWVSSTSG